VTQATTFESGKLSPKISVKYAHSSGFTVEKFEVASDGKITTETSLNGTYPGLKLEFKGNDSDKGDLSLQFNHKLATLTADVDALSFKNASGSVLGGHGPFTFGSSVALKLAKGSVESSTITLGAGYAFDKQAFGAVKAKNFSDFSAIFSYTASPVITFAALLNAAKGYSGSLGLLYKCNPQTTIKAKIASSGDVNASVKQNFPGKLSVVAAAQVPSTLASYKFGIAATLG
jgi:Eukaryotic porin